MEKSPLSTVALGTLTISGTSALVTGIWTAFRRTPQAGLIVTAAAVNSAVTGAAFFVVREFSVGPTLTKLAPFEQYARRRRELGIDEPSNDSPISSTMSPSEVRTHKILDSSISGTITGGLLRGIRSGPKAIFPGMIMGTMAATVLQYGYNELNLARLRYALKLIQENRTAVEKPVIRPRKFEPAPQSNKTWMDTFVMGLGLTPITDEEYIVKMKKTRDVYLKRIEELELKVEEEKMLTDLSKP